MSPFKKYVCVYIYIHSHRYIYIFKHILCPGIGQFQAYMLDMKRLYFSGSHPWLHQILMPGSHPQGFWSMAWTFQRVSKVEDLSFISSLKTPIPTALISMESSQSQLPVWLARATVEIKHVLWTALERRWSCTDSTRLWYLSKTSWLSLTASMGFCLGKMLEQASKVRSHELKQDDRVRQ